MRHRYTVTLGIQLPTQLTTVSINTDHMLSNSHITTKKEKI